MKINEKINSQSKFPSVNSYETFSLESYNKFSCFLYQALAGFLHGSNLNVSDIGDSIKYMCENHKKQIEIDRQKGYKVCSKCHNQKTLTEFAFRKSLNTYYAQCKKCQKNKKPTIKRKRKECNKCNKTKNISKFYKLIGSQDGTMNYCKKCRNEEIKTWQNNNPEKVKASKEKYKPTKNIKNKEWAKQNREKINNYFRNRRKNDEHFRILNNLRTRLNHLLEGKPKDKTTKELLGCSIDFFKSYLESKFIEGMDWRNYGKQEGDWHIDHVVCCELFDLSDKRQLAACFHYTNLNPKWGIDNYKKNDKLNDGRRARNLTKEEKLNYLKFLGYDFVSPESNRRPF